MEGFVKEVVEEQLLEIKILGVGSGDVFQEDDRMMTSPINVTGIPRSRALAAVHFPVLV